MYFRTSRLPVLYVFGRESIDVNKCVSEFARVVDNKDSAVIIMYDVVFSHAAGNLDETIHLGTLHKLISITR